MLFLTWRSLLQLYEEVQILVCGQSKCSGFAEHVREVLVLLGDWDGTFWDWTIHSGDMTRGGKTSGKTQRRPYLELTPHPVKVGIVELNPLGSKDDPFSDGGQEQHYQALSTFTCNLWNTEFPPAHLQILLMLSWSAWNISE